MVKITQKQLIEQIKQLKEIKPRKEWAILLKSQILIGKQVELEVPVRQAKSVGTRAPKSNLVLGRALNELSAQVMDVLSFVFFQKS